MFNIEWRNTKGKVQYVTGDLLLGWALVPIKSLATPMPSMPHTIAELQVSLTRFMELIGPGFHPDTRADDYDSPVPFGLDATLDEAFEKMGDDVYEYCYAEFVRLGWLPR